MLLKSIGVFDVRLISQRRRRRRADGEEKKSRKSEEEEVKNGDYRERRALERFDIGSSSGLSIYYNTSTWATPR